MRRALPVFLLSGSFLTFAEPGWKEFQLGPASPKGPVNPRGAVRDGTLRARSISARTLLAIAGGVSPSRVMGPDWIDSERYRISAVLDDAKSLRARGAGRNDAFRRLFAQEIVRRFQIEFQRERREASGFEARLSPETVIRAKRSKSLEGAQFRDGGIPVINTRRTLDVRGATIPELLDWLERHWLRAPVVAVGAPIEGVWDFRVRWTTADRDSLLQAVREKVGIEIAPADVSPEYLVIQRIHRPPAD
jgi:uncharacterized protein (TIGR03435 family)